MRKIEGAWKWGGWVLKRMSISLQIIGSNISGDLGKKEVSLGNTRAKGKYDRIRLRNGEKKVLVLMDESVCSQKPVAPHKPPQKRTPPSNKLGNSSKEERRGGSKPSDGGRVCRTV